MSAIHCCNEMHRQVEESCLEHPDPFDCPDALIHYSPDSQEYGIIIHDGEQSYAAIRFCPWCGKKLLPG